MAISHTNTVVVNLKLSLPLALSIANNMPDFMRGTWPLVTNKAIVAPRYYSKKKCGLNTK